MAPRKKIIKIEEKSVKTRKKRKGAKARSPSSKSLSSEEIFYIVGIGASAGGLAALETFFKNMPIGNKIAFVVISHLDPAHSSILPELIQKSTQLKVFQIQDGVLIEPNCVYVIPPNRNVAILNKTFQLLEPVKGSNPRMSIDHFFRSLAEDQKEKAIGVILSGMGTDGTLGLRAIKGGLGMVMVQEPESAQNSSMPRNAIETGLVDYVLAPEKMPEVLVKYTQNTVFKIAETIPEFEENLPAALQKIYVLIRTHTGHDFSLYKKNTICRRIERRMNVHHLEDIAHYVSYLQETPQEVLILFKELLIGVTNFFRDPEAFNILSKNVFPQLLENKPNGYTVRIWIPGCSSGEEAYSIAILLRECMEQLNCYFNVQVFATDIDEEAINFARRGLFPFSITSDINEGRLKRFFIKEEEGYQVKKDIREMIIFAVQNVIKDPPFTKLDIVSCRNLLIYMGAELQSKLFPVFHYSLVPEGILFLGASESIGNHTDLFVSLEKKWKIYLWNKDTLPRVRVEMKLQPTASIIKENSIEFGEKTMNSSVLFEKILLQEYALPSVIVNQNGEILYVHGQTAKFLELPTGKGKIYSIFEMARNGLKTELPMAIRKSIMQNEKVVYENLSIKNGNGSNGSNGSALFNLIVKPFSFQGSTEGVFMVSFETRVLPKKEDEVKIKPRKGKHPKELETLEQELELLKEKLQNTTEGMETSNEELRSANEEMQSTNEELQSTNEELETSKEEQNSLNEELVTVNSELQAKIEELSKAASDMKNLMNAIEVPTLFLDLHLNITRFTKDVDRVINLLSSDIGRHVGDLTFNLKYETLIEDAQQVLDDLIPKRIEVETKEGHWYSLKILPYRTLENVIDGVVMAFIDISELKVLSVSKHELEQEIVERRQAEQQLRASETQLQTVLSKSPLRIVLSHVDQDLRYTWLYNPHPDFKTEEVLGKRDDELNENEGMRQLFELKRRVIMKGKGEEKIITFPLSDGIRNYKVFADPMYDESGNLTGVATCSVDITNLNPSKTKK